jgi:DNA-binding response OmpR family regulator
VDKVLIVDDNYRIRKLLVDILSLRFTVLEAGTADEARRSIAEDQPELIFLDVILPDQNGFDFCAEIRACPETARIPVIISTGLGGREDVVRAFAAGATDYIVKPFTLLTVLEKVEKVLGGEA